MSCSLILVHLLVLGHVVVGLQWPFGSWNFPKLSISSQSSTTDIAELLPAEIEAVIQNMETLESYNKSPDCFRQAAKSFRSRCAELGMNEEERIRGAISMTLCDLATAQHHNPPLECQPFAMNGNELPSPSASYSSCVEAFSRSAQFWTSYSGYLREIPQLCFAYRRWNDIDTAKALYHNATLEKLSFLKLLKKRENWLADQEEALTTSLKNLGDSLTRLEEGTQSLDQHTNGLTERTNIILSEMDDHIAQTVRRAESRLQESQQAFNAELNSILSHTGEEHTKGLHDILLASRNTLQDGTSVVLRTMQENSAILVATTAALHQDWAHLGQRMVALQKTVSHLNGATERLSVELSSHARQAAENREMHLAATASLTSLAGAMQELTTFVQSEMSALNATAIKIRNELSLGIGTDWLDWWIGWVVKVLRASGQWDVSDLDLQYVVQHPAMRMAAFVLSTLWSVGRYVLTTLIGSVILTLSASKLADNSSNSRPSNSSKSRPVSLVSPTASLAPSSSRQAAKSRSGTADIESIRTPRSWSVTPTPATPLASAFTHNSTSNIIAEEDENDENDQVADLTDQFVGRRMTRSASRSHSEPPSVKAAGSRGSSVGVAGTTGCGAAGSHNQTPYATRRTSRVPSSGRGSKL